MTYNTHRSNKGGKNSTLSTSPKRRDGSQTTGLGSSANYQRKQKSVEKLGHKKSKKHHQNQQLGSDQKGPNSGSGGSGEKKGGSISDLHQMIKTIERDLTEKFRNMKDLNAKGTPATPNQILRKVED